MAAEDTYIHLLAGGAGGTAGAVLTCPLEVVKTRLQSSCSTFKPSPTQFVRKVPLVPHTVSSTAAFGTCATTRSTPTLTTSCANASRGATTTPSGVETTRLISCLRYIVQNEGVKGLFKGLGPNLIGVAPSRAIYFCAYAQAKSMCNDVFPADTPIVHICSAAVAGFTASTMTNPIWYLKTRLQLDQKRSGSLTVRQCIRDTYRRLGIVGFYKGITASYYGISETVIHFVIYENLKARLREMKGIDINNIYDDDRTVTDFLEYMVAGATSKTIATCIAYPHEVARTRLREEGTVYVGFWQTLRHVYHTEGHRGLYRGLATQLVRQIPNTAVMMATYEAVVYLCHKHLHPHDHNNDDGDY